MTRVRVPGDQEVFVDLDQDLGEITVTSPQPISAVQSANLREVLYRAERILETGVGELVAHPT